MRILSRRQSPTSTTYDEDGCTAAKDIALETFLNDVARGVYIKRCQDLSKPNEDEQYCRNAVALTSSSSRMSALEYTARAKVMRAYVLFISHMGIRTTYLTHAAPSDRHYVRKFNYKRERDREMPLASVSNPSLRLRFRLQHGRARGLVSTHTGRLLQAGEYSIREHRRDKLTLVVPDLVEGRPEDDVVLC